jgi:MFS family permease
MISLKRMHPVMVGLLTMPYGIAVGWASGTLPVTLEQHGFFPGAAAMVAVPGLSLLAWQILPAPFVDFSLSLRRWYLMGLALSIGGMLPFLWLPLEQETADLMKLLIGVSLLGALLMLLAAMGWMARYVPADKIGRAAGWYQVGFSGGQGLALMGIYALGGTVSWKIVHLAEILLMLVGMSVLYFLPADGREKKLSVNATAAQAIFDGRSWLRSSKGIFTCLMALSPIGIGAATVGWSIGTRLYAIPENEIRLVLGPLSLVCSLAGFLAGGWASDRYGRWTTWLRAGGLLAVVALLIAFCPFISWLFNAGLLIYAFVSSACAAAFWAIIVQAVSPLLAVTKITLLSMLIAIPLSYMRAFDGRVCDHYGFQLMLIGEALLSLICIGIAFLLKRRLI